MTATPSGGQTILVIEDDQDTVDFLELFLDMSGYQVQTAGTGAHGLALATAHTIAAVLLDRRLPDMDGVTVCERLRAQLGMVVPIILLTADHDPALHTAARDAGVSAVLQKPFAPDALLQQLAAMLAS